MENHAETLLQLQTQIGEISQYGQKLIQRFALEIAQMPPPAKEGAQNLLYYLAVRQFDIRDWQKELGKLGLSRLGKAEGHIQASLEAIQHNLRCLSGQTPANRPDLDFDQGKELLEQNATALLGPPSPHRRVRIMVTLPSEAAADAQLVKDLLLAGMNCARINCAHDDALVWQQMVAQVRQASQATGLPCKICIDLAGPKLRTGAVATQTQVLQLCAPRDDYGRILGNYQVWVSEQMPPQIPGHSHWYHLPLPRHFFEKAQPGDEWSFRDTRNKSRHLRITAVLPEGIWAEANQTAYVMNGLELALYHKDKWVSQAILAGLPDIPQKIMLRKDDTLVLHREDRPGEPAQKDESGQVLAPAHIACPLDWLYTDLRPGEPILFDDGKIEGQILSVSATEAHIRITHTPPGGAVLRADKGINLPLSNLRFSGLTEKDRQDLKFVCQHADVVNMSFVNSPEDVEELLKVLSEEGAPAHLGLVLKIETQRAVLNLPAILLTALRFFPVGVMIARGDLAVECGWQKLAEIQEEILRVCEAAYVPNVWATQVLETVAKKGRPSRAEITDAAMAQRAECVMLNKGPFILEAIRLLNEILQRMQPQQEKKVSFLPELKLPEVFRL